jgi:hypothetical protein
VSVEELLTQAVTLRRLSGETRSPTGASEPTYETTTTVMYLEPKLEGSSEAEGDRNTGIGAWLGVALASDDFDHWDQVLYGGKVLDITAPLRPMWDPRAGAVSHVELDLREVT